MASAFDGFLEQAWADHAEQSAAVAQRLRTETPPPETPDQLAALSRLVVHLCGEHLGAFDDGRGRLAALRTHLLANPDVQSALRVGSASLTLAETGRADRGGFTFEERIRSEAAAAAICVGRQDTRRAMQLLRSARTRLEATTVASAAVHRPLAVACNNMAWALCERDPGRSVEDSAAMLDIAAASRIHWAVAGTWLEVERADYCLALCHLSAGLPEQALEHAGRCLAGCTQNDAPPYEQFFAYEALARAYHARGDRAAQARNVAAAQAAFEKLAADDKGACHAALATLQALAL